MQIIKNQEKKRKQSEIENSVENLIKKHKHEKNEMERSLIEAYESIN